ncbi:membrane protein YczE [Streptomyces sp. NPDC001700]
MGLQVRAALGLDPWDVFHQGIAKRAPLSFGTVTIIVGVAVLLLWIPLRQRPGLGTVSNVIVIGVTVDATLWLVPHPDALALRAPLLVFSVVLGGAATGLYISARFGPGPRDGLMTGLHQRTGRSIRLVRTGIEVAVLATGFALGGSVGVGTVLYALAIGPLSQYFLRLFAIPSATGDAADGVAGGAPGGATESSPVVAQGGSRSPIRDLI